MLKNSHYLFALIALSLCIAACKPSENSGKAKSGKWLPYPEQKAFEEQQLRASLKVEKREGMSNVLKDTVETWYPSELSLYNQYGQITLSQLMDSEGKVTKETKYEYRDSLLIKEIIKESSGYSSAMEYGYNEKGQKISELMFQRGDSVLRRSYVVDANGNEMEVELLKFRDGAKFKLETQRNEKGEPIHVKELQDGVPNWTEVYEISDSLWRIKRSDAQNHVQGDYEMRFDQNQAITQMINRDESGKIRISIVYTNDAQGRNLKEQYFGGQGQAMQASEFRYNDQGLLVERTFSSPTSPQKTITRYTYSFRK
jgi:hypothetical protein